MAHEQRLKGDQHEATVGYSLDNRRFAKRSSRRNARTKENVQYTNGKHVIDDVKYDQYERIKYAHHGYERN